MINPAITLPSTTGIYAVFFNLDKTCTIKIGNLGECIFPLGTYIYLGSAFGPGGLKGRLGRHLSLTTPKMFWHIDYLRTLAKVSGYAYYLTKDRIVKQGGQNSVPLECLWSQTLEQLTYMYTPVTRFGASDCRSGCKAHLVSVSQTPNHELSTNKQLLRNIINVLSKALNLSSNEMLFISHQSI